MAAARKGQQQTTANSPQSGIWGKIIAPWLNCILGHLSHSNEMAVVVTRPLHLPDDFLPDYRAGSRGDYLPTGTHLIYVHRFVLVKCKSPLSRMLVHITWQRSPRGPTGVTEGRHREIYGDRYKIRSLEPAFSHTSRLRSAEEMSVCRSHMSRNISISTHHYVQTNWQLPAGYTVIFTQTTIFLCRFFAKTKERFLCLFWKDRVHVTTGHWHVLQVFVQECTECEEQHFGKRCFTESGLRKIFLFCPCTRNRF